MNFQKVLIVCRAFSFCEALQDPVLIRTELHRRIAGGWGGGITPQNFSGNVPTVMAKLIEIGKVG